MILRSKIVILFCKKLYDISLGYIDHSYPSVMSSYLKKIILYCLHAQTILHGIKKNILAILVIFLKINARLVTDINTHISIRLN